MSFAKNGHDLKEYTKRAELAVEKIMRDNPHLAAPTPVGADPGVKTPKTPR